MGWFGSDFFFNAHVHVLVHGVSATETGIHLNFVLILVAAVLITSLAGTLIGLPTLRLRSDYIAIVTLAFGEIIGVVAVNGTSISLGSGQTLTAGPRGSRRSTCPYFPGIGHVQPARAETLVLADLRDHAARPVRQPAAARLAAGAGLDRAARG